MPIPPGGHGSSNYWHRWESPPRRFSDTRRMQPTAACDRPSSWQWAEKSDGKASHGKSRRRWKRSLLKLYRDDPDAGVHSACRWLLRTRLQAAANLEQVDRSLAGQASPAQRWYVGPNGHSFSVFRGPDNVSCMGSPANELSREEDEARHEERSRTQLCDFHRRSHDRAVFEVPRQDLQSPI